VKVDGLLYWIPILSRLLVLQCMLRPSVRCCGSGVARTLQPPRTCAIIATSFKFQPMIKQTPVMSQHSKRLRRTVNCVSRTGCKLRQRRSIDRHFSHSNYKDLPS